LRVAILSSEAVPFAKTGGLADVAGALPKALVEHGADASLVIPLYEQIDRKHLRELIIDNLEVEWQGKTRARVWHSDAAGAPAFLIEAPKYFQRNSIYGFRDDHERFAFFCRAALALFKRLGAPPEIVHLNDWHSGFAAVELRTRRSVDSYYARTRYALFDSQPCLVKGCSTRRSWNGWDLARQSGASLLWQTARPMP
jgi:Glycogen synthase